jgi:hypothetical protein
VVVDSARIEPVSISNYLLTGKLTGNFAETGPFRWDFDAQSASQFNGLQPNSLRNGTGNFQTCIRENFQGTGNFRARCPDASILNFEQPQPTFAGTAPAKRP